MKFKVIAVDSWGTIVRSRLVLPYPRVGRKRQPIQLTDSFEGRFQRPGLVFSR
ncbi:MAG: hypothetical protein M9883_14515 [Methylobacteriaceae bacterium]|nr:hypothetical protein [Methylobacteriaceae bacterium]